MVTSLTDGIGPPSLMSAETARRDLSGVMEFVPLTWLELAHGVRPLSPPAELDPSDWRIGWQHEAASRVEAHHRASVTYPSADERERAFAHSGHRVDLWQECLSPLFPETITPARSRSCPGCCCFAVSACLPLPPTVHLCRCGRQQDSFGHHRAACAQGGGCWPDEGSRLRLQPPRCVEKQAQGSHPTSWSAIWTCQHHIKS